MSAGRSNNDVDARQNLMVSFSSQWCWKWIDFIQISKVLIKNTW